MEELSAFLSYSREDANFAWDIALTLRELHIDVWMDQLDIAPGEHWDRAIHAALRDCTHMLVVHSSASFTSNNVWDEWSYFLNRRKPVIPLIIEPVELPFRLERVQYIDFANMPFKKAVEQLLSILRPVNRPGMETETMEMRIEDLDDTRAQEPIHWVDRSGKDRSFDPSDTDAAYARKASRNRYGR
jgi:hypothetical protein